MNPKKVSVIILNYNTEQDLKTCAQQISDQVGVHLSIIIVDNCSAIDSVERIKEWLTGFSSNTILLTQDDCDKLQDLSDRDVNSVQIYFIENFTNKGYSAGNNIGIKLAKKLNSDAVLIANPDMRFEDNEYIFKLSKALVDNKSYYIAASKILGLDGKDQNPQREATFIEELTQFPMLALKKIFPKTISRPSNVIKVESHNPVTVPKVSGCCLMIRMSFLRTIDYLDEHVFLYCEEPILSAQVEKESGKILYVPNILAIHAHRKSEKGNSDSRMLLFIESRKYYLAKYSGYNRLKLSGLYFSYYFLALFYKLKILLNK